MKPQTKIDKSNTLPSPSHSKNARGGIRFTEPSRTRQSEREDCDINAVMARYERTGIITHTKQIQGQYGDFSNIPSYQEAMNQIMLAQNQFNSLPSDLRKQFENDPVQFVHFMDNPDNEEKARSMGLLNPLEPQKDHKPGEGTGKDEKPSDKPPTPPED